MKPTRVSPLLALVLAAAPAYLAAQRDTVSRDAPLSLRQAVSTAEENNPQYRRALTEVATAEAEVRRARGAFLPEVGLTFSAGGSYSRTLTGVDPYGEVIRRPQGVLESNGSDARQTLQLSNLSLFDGGQRRRDLAARVGAEASRVRAEVTRRYWDGVRTERVIALEEALLSAARDRVTLAQALMRVGVRGPLDVLTAEVGVAEQEQALERARGDARKAQLELKAVMGVPDAGSLRLTDEPPSMFDPTTLGADAVVQHALSVHPRIQRVDMAVQQSVERYGSARAARLPRLSLSSSLGRSQRYSDYGGLVSINPLDQSAGLSLNLQVPLFTGFRNAYTVQSARAARDAATEDARGERLALERDVRSAMVDLDNAFRAARLAERTLDLNRQRLQLAQEQYRVGALTQSDLTDAVAAAARSEREALRARFEFANALTTLEERAGGPVRP
jgi:outer membrane protein